jgi:hypothetical protein
VNENQSKVNVPFIGTSKMTKRASELAGVLHAEINKGGATVADVAAVVVQLIKVAPQLPIGIHAVQCLSSGGAPCGACQTVLAILSEDQITDIGSMRIDEGVSVNTASGAEC